MSISRYTAVLLSRRRVRLLSYRQRGINFSAISAGRGGGGKGGGITDDRARERRGK